MLRFLTSGESHGKGLIAMVEGFPAGLDVDVEKINDELFKRQQGYGRGARQKIERDQAVVMSGVRHGTTTGAPISLVIENKDWENWLDVMSTTPIDLTDSAIAEKMAKKLIKHFRPGHADLAGTIKYGHDDIRDVLERASARETAARVAAGALCQQLLAAFGIKVSSHVIQVGSVKAELKEYDNLADLDADIADSELFCANQKSAEEMKEFIKKTWTEGDSLGGVIEVLADGLPVGLGSYTQWDRKLDGRLAQALMSIQAMKAVELGDGMTASGLKGSQVHDALYPSAGELPFKRVTNRAGGLEGGMTNGERLVARVFMKPIPTLLRGLDSVSYPDFKAHKADYERSDVCAIAAASVVARAMVAITLAGAFLDKFGGDSISDIRHSYENYRTKLRVGANARSDSD
ncbi:MAG: chorismate synthase [Candidatus Melainabacteria bacterium]|nr:chorismate synthase [Candidatus Melainabacteria bacterium]